MRPQLGVGGGTPRPRKLRAASSSKMSEVLSAAITTMIGKTLGRMCSAINRRDGAPSAWAPTTKSRLDIDRVSARTTRAIEVHETNPITMKIVRRLGPRTATRAIASSSGGRDSIRSVKRIRIKSTAPPKNPEHSPMAMPMVIVTAIAATPTVSEIRAPKMIRESTSRPSSSVPMRNLSDGAPGSPKVGATTIVGSCGARTGAKTATITSRVTIAAPTVSSVTKRRMFIRSPPAGCAGRATRKAGQRAG
jgi:hypothetical protein